MNIEKRNGKNGVSYRIRVYAGIDATGKKRIVSETYTPHPGMSERQAYKEAYQIGLELEKRCDRGAPIDYDRLTFSDFVEGMYEEQHLSKLKSRTQAGYREVLQSRLIPYFGNMYLRKIKPGTIRAWLDGLGRLEGSRFQGKLTDTSKADWFRTLSAILGKAYEWELIDENPCRRVKTPSKAKINVLAWQLEDVRKVLNNLSSYKNQRAVIFLLLALNSGLREGELAGLQWSDFDFDNNQFSVNRTIHYEKGGLVIDTPKTIHGYRDVPFSDALKKELLKYKAWQETQMAKLGDSYLGNPGLNAHVFMAKNGKPVYDTTFRKWLKDYCEWCGVPRIPVHALRHTFASVLIANNVDARTAADILGHSSASLVLDVYANPQDEAKRRAVQKLWDVYNKTDS